MSEVPASINDERAVLGAILVNRPALQTATIDTGLKPDHFYLDRHREIFAAVLKVASEGAAADELTVAALLPAQRAYLSELTANVPSLSNVGAYARRVIELAGMRTKLAGAQEIIAGVRDQDHNRIQSGVLAVSTDLEAQAEPSTPEELWDDMYEWLQQEPDAGETFRLPWPELHRHCAGGFRRGQMVLVTGWSEQGKSLVISQMLRQWAQDGHKSLLLTTEMHRRELIARYLATETGIGYEKIMRRKGLGAPEWRKLNDAGLRIPFHHHDAEGWSVDRILSAIVTQKPDVAVIDPANLIPRKSYEDVPEQARRLKEIAARANCCVIVVVHLKPRSGHQGEDLPRPAMFDIRDSGMWYTNAHSVLALWRKQNESGGLKAEGELFFMKSRDAPKGGIDVEFNPRRLRFDPVGTAEKEEAEREPELFA